MANAAARLAAWLGCGEQRRGSDAGKPFIRSHAGVPVSRQRLAVGSAFDGLTGTESNPGSSGQPVTVFGIEPTTAKRVLHAGRRSRRWLHGRQRSAIRQHQRSPSSGAGGDVPGLRSPTDAYTLAGRAEKGGWPIVPARSRATSWAVSRRKRLIRAGRRRTGRSRRTLWMEIDATDIPSSAVIQYVRRHRRKGAVVPPPRLNAATASS